MTGSRSKTKSETEGRAAGKAGQALEVDLPAEFAHEISRVAAATQRSTAFIALRALQAAPTATAPAANGPTQGLTVAPDEDDPANILAKVKAAAGKRPLADALAAAWAATRHRFAKFLERSESARAAEAADDLDHGLAAASDPATSVEDLTALATSAYPRIRALVAAHPRTPAAVITKLLQDREPYVRDAAENRKLAG